MAQLSTELLLLVLALLICLSAFFSGTETALMSLNRYRLRHLSKQGKRSAVLAERLLQRPDRLIGIILIGNNIVNILATMVTTMIGFKLGGETGAALAALVLVIVILVFAEVTPKTLAALKPETLAFPASYIYYPLLKVFWPLVSILNFLTNGLLRLFGFKNLGDNFQKLGREELRTIVHDFGGEVSQRHQEMMLGVLDLDAVSVEDIMIPRNEVEGLDLEDDWDDILHQVQHSKHTWMPVFTDDIDQINGMLHLRRLIRDLSKGNLTKESLTALLQEPYYILETTPLNKQLMQFQQHHRRIALVVDEYGDVQGLVTLEDLLEEIVGELNSNPLSIEQDIIANQDGTFLLQGSANIREVNKTIAWNLPTEEAKTINGLIIEELGSFPKTGDKIQIDAYEFSIIHAKANTIKTVKARKLTL